MKLTLLVTFKETKFPCPKTQEFIRYVSINNVHITGKEAFLPPCDDSMNKINKLAESHNCSNTSEVYEKMEEHILKLEFITKAYRSDQGKYKCINNIETYLSGLTNFDTVQFVSKVSSDTRPHSVNRNSIYSAKLYTSEVLPTYLYLISKKYDDGQQSCVPANNFYELPLELTVNKPKIAEDSCSKTRCRTYKLKFWHTCGYEFVSEKGLQC